MFIYVLEMHAGLGGYSRIVEIVKAKNAKEARRKASANIYPNDKSTDKYWTIIKKIKENLVI